MSKAETAPRFQWAQQLTGKDHLWAYDLAIDTGGNSYVCGYMPSTGVFGSIVLTNYLPPPWRSYGGAFLVKYAIDGRVLWTVQGGNQNSEALGVSVDDNDSAYILCSLRSATAPLGGTNITGVLGLAKYTSTGQPIWGRSIASVPPEAPMSVNGGSLAVAPTGQSYWVANFSGGYITSGTNSFQVRTFWNGVLGRCEADGQVAWARHAEAPYPFSTTYGDVAVNRNGDPYVCGQFSGTATLGATSIVSRGATDLMVARYSSTGEVLWLRTAGGPGDDSSYQLSVDAAGNCFIAGHFFHQMSFGEVALTNEIATNFFFVAKYSPDGDLVWARQAAQSRYNGYDHCITTDLDGNCYFAGQLSSTGGIHYAKYSADGETQWSRTVEQRMVLSRMRSDQLGHCYLAGAYNTPNLQFDHIALDFTRGFNFDSYLARLDTTTIPRLTIQPSDGELLVSWPTVADQYYLESKTDMTTLNGWTSNAIPPTVSGSRKTIRYAPTGPGALYRLKRQ